MEECWGITVCRKSPCLIRKAVFHWSPAAIFLRLYPFFRSNLLNHFPPYILFSKSLISGSGFFFGFVTGFRALWSTQSMRNPSFLCTNRIRRAAAGQECLTLPVDIFSCSYLQRDSSSSQVVLHLALVGIFTFQSCSRI